MQQYPGQPNNDPTYPGSQQPQPYQPSQPQYPQQQPYPGQPYQQPPTPPPPPKKRRTWLIVAIVAVVVLVACVSSLALASRGLGTVTPPVATTGTSGQPTTASTQGAPTSAPTGQTLSVGQTYTGSTWKVLVNSIKTSTGGDFNKPDAGTVFVLVNVSVTNTSGQQQVLSSLINFVLRDSTGQSLNVAIDTSVPNAPDGNVAAGRTIRGTLAYQAPTSEKTFTLDFSDLASNDSASWSLHV